MITTAGQILVNELLPEDLRSYTRVIDQNTLKKILHDVSIKHSDKYREIAHSLSELGREVSFRQGSSFSLKDLKPIEQRNVQLDAIKREVEKIQLDSRMTDEHKKQKIATFLSSKVMNMHKTMYAKLKDAGNPFAIQVFSGSRGKPAQLGALLSTPLVAPDASGVPISMPIMHSYSEGLDPAEYWATTYGARSGLIDVKFATQDAGYLGKQMAQASHNLVITEDDCETKNGILVDSGDQDNVGALLISGVGSYKRGTILTPLKMKDMKKKSKRLYIRSPITCQAETGLCAKCSGVRDKGTLPSIGDNVGIPSATALSERLSQGQLSAKHSATGGAAISGFEYINQLMQVPKSFKSGAAVASLDGNISKIEKAPQGGHYIYIGGERHHVAEGQGASVKVGEEVEAGDVLSDGIPNPSEIVRHKGIGEGRRYFADLLKKAFEESGMPANRRNTELMARSMINHVVVTEPDASLSNLPGDIVGYDTMIRNYVPRHGSKRTPIAMSKGKYLEEAAMHFSVGTRVTKRVAKALREAGYKQLQVHDDVPSFEPRMYRLPDAMANRPDWLEQQLGWNLKKNLLKSVQTASNPSNLDSTSYVPKLITGEI